jgi:hypothetical protein
MGCYKSTSWFWLFKHAAVYSLWGLLIEAPTYLISGYFVIYLFLTHSLIDAATSRIKSEMRYTKNDSGLWLFNNIDGILHVGTIFFFLINFME